MAQQHIINHTVMFLLSTLSKMSTTTIFLALDTCISHLMLTFIKLLHLTSTATFLLLELRPPHIFNNYFLPHYFWPSPRFSILQKSSFLMAYEYIKGHSVPEKCWRITK